VVTQLHDVWGQEIDPVWVQYLRHNVSPKRWYRPTRLHGVRAQDFTFSVKGDMTALLVREADLLVRHSVVILHRRKLFSILSRVCDYKRGLDW
jgi:hypothetical protein